MGEKGCCGEKTGRKIIIGLTVAGIIIAIIYYSHVRSGASIHSLLPDSVVRTFNLTDPEIESNPDTRSAVTNEDVKDLQQSVEAYKASLPTKIVDTINGLVREHLAG